MIEVIIGATLPTPPNFEAGDTAGWAFTIWASMFAVALLPWVIWRLRKGDAIPGLIFIGGAICSLTEPMADHATHLWWATDVFGPAFKAYDLSVPAFIPPAHIAGYGMAAYFVYERLAAGPSVKGVFRIWAVLMVLFAIFEQPGVLPGVYEYYGDQPFEFYKYPLYNAWLNATAVLLSAFLLLNVLRVTSGRSRWVVMLVPVSGMVCSWSVAAWPIFMALNWDMAPVLQWLLASLSLVISVLMVRGVGEFLPRVEGKAPPPNVRRPVRQTVPTG